MLKELITLIENISESYSFSTNQQEEDFNRVSKEMLQIVKREESSEDRSPKSSSKMTINFSNNNPSFSASFSKKPILSNI